MKNEQIMEIFGQVVDEGLAIGIEAKEETNKQSHIYTFDRFFLSTKLKESQNPSVFHETGNKMQNPASLQREQPSSSAMLKI